VFGLPRLETWRGVLGALNNWRRGPDGPTAEEVKAARRSMAAARPTVFHRAPTRTEADVAATIEAGKQLRAMLDAEMAVFPAGPGRSRARPRAARATGIATTIAHNGLPVAGGHKTSLSPTGRRH